MTSRRYDVVSFDLGSTLVYLDPTRLAELLADHGVETSPASLLTVEQVARDLTDHPALIAGRTGDELWRLFLDTLLAGIGVAPGPRRRALVDLVERENENHRLWAHVPPDVPPLLDRLRAAGYRLLVVSNGGGGVRSFLESRGLAGAFEVIVDSFLVGVEKPDPRIFGLVLDRIGVPSERVAHVGDFYHVDVIGAERAGLTGVLLDPSATRSQGRCPSIRTLMEIEAFLALPNSGSPIQGTNPSSL